MVYYTDMYGREWELYEERQVYPNGHILRRKNFNGVAETLKRGESPRDGIHRCLREELKWLDPSQYKLSDKIFVEERPPVDSEKWPRSSISAAYHRNVCPVDISHQLFKINGYDEVEDDRVIYFKWRPRRPLTLTIE